MPTTIVGLEDPQCVNEFVGPFFLECEEEPCKVEWFVKEAPAGIDPESVEFSAPFNVETLIKFPSLGKFIICGKCYIEGCNPLINESEGKQLNIFCQGGNGFICGHAVGFAPSDVVTLTIGGVTDTVAIQANGAWCFGGQAFPDGTQGDVVVNGINHNGCSISASETFIFDSLEECIDIFDIECSAFGMQVTYVNCGQVCGVVQGYTFGDTVTALVNGNLYSTVVFPDPDPNPANNGKPIWCIDFSDDDFATIEGQTVVISIDNGTCQGIYPYVHY